MNLKNNPCETKQETLVKGDHAKIKQYFCARSFLLVWKSRHFRHNQFISVMLTYDLVSNKCMFEALGLDLILLGLHT